MTLNVFHPISHWRLGILLLALLSLSACTLPRNSAVPVVYDFGPGALHDASAPDKHRLAPLEFSTPQSHPALGSTAVLYRLAYADEQQLKPYALARWSMPPAQLIGLRLREHLGQQRAIVSRGDVTPTSPPRTGASAASSSNTRREPLHHLQVELEEFSQLFESPQTSSGVLRLRVTLTQRGPALEGLLAQRSFIARVSALTADASGGVHALTAACDQLARDIEAWLAQVEPSTAPASAPM
jgi:cholesterol transport system auxiliary component